jgi:hypothetical protein
MKPNPLAEVDRQITLQGDRNSNTGNREGVVVDASKVPLIMINGQYSTHLTKIGDYTLSKRDVEQLVDAALDWVNTHKSNIPDDANGNGAWDAIIRKALSDKIVEVYGFEMPEIDSDPTPIDNSTFYQGVQGVGADFSGVT